MQISILVKPREKARMVRPKVEAKKGPLYRVEELNTPSALFLLALIGVSEKKPE